MENKSFILWFKEVDKDDTSIVGGKGANLGEMLQAGFPVPNGFIVTAQAYFYVLDENKLRERIRYELGNVDVHDPQALTMASSRIKRLVNRARIPDDLANQIISYYDHLGGNSLVAVRSSATAEDLPEASFAGQQETFLNIRGEANVVDAVRKAWASLFEPRAIFYREQKKFNHFKVGIAVPVQLMIQSEISGVMFTVNPVTNDKDKIVIEAIWGLGEKIVQGAITPDHYQVRKTDWSIFHKEIVEQRVQLIKRGTVNREVAVAAKLQPQAKLSDDQIMFLAKLGHKLHQHYFFPQDIEWSYEKGKFYIVQTRPITTMAAVASKRQTSQKLTAATSNLKRLLVGDPASPGLVSGPVRILPSIKDLHKVKPGDIIVTSMTTPSFVPIMHKAKALITDKGGQTSHAAIVSRELGLPCIVGADKATRILKTGQVVTVNAQTGEVFAGGLPGRALPVLKKITGDGHYFKTATKVYVNLADPTMVAEVSKRNVDGIGLLRAEFMIAQLGVHPKKLIEEKKSDLIVAHLADNIEKFCVSFGERPVIYRSNDFKTNEYRGLSGGSRFEPKEENPFLGLRGAFRYIVDPQIFELELTAIKEVRNKRNCKNLHLMIPFVRTVKELTEVKRLIAANGLTRTPSFKLYLMVEIPANVVILKDFAKVGIDGISIGSNDLTMLVLGADRDNEELTAIYDERNPAVLFFLEMAIRQATKLGLTSSICGQAPSIHPDLTEKLVGWGISSVSVSPDMIETTREIVYEAEKRKVSK
ncbi:pyruvate, water dikinase [Microgenomates group bacterium RIFCSPLOWO2_01_FULL_46_13]|nr:MAG: pyruvate, water dikinase [Microgenomates group bacterium RIFCSPHIGHO2_01_FULL_45_11]OGV94686.1 MAG: pyruvate, water dikinase [Microgenomates group bacterium RIFCSPLOWO2_01_FULL_46_13]